MELWLSQASVRNEIFTCGHLARRHKTHFSRHQPIMEHSLSEQSANNVSFALKCLPVMDLLLLRNLFVMELWSLNMSTCRRTRLHDNF